VYKLVKELSGGERAKLGLAMLMAKDNNLLILDEPTNHLDLPSREALEDALKAYTGTLLVVSHDRYFVNSLATTIVELENKQLNTYVGNYDSFIATKSKVPTDTPKQTKPTSTYRNQKQRAEQTNRAKRLKELENLITNLEQEIENLQNQMVLPEIASDFSKLSQIMQQLDVANAKLEQALVEWEELSQE
jgi:ATP-binding cassette subfamily F protein 3